MEIRKLPPAEHTEALRLVLKTFMEFEAPDYPAAGVKTFCDFLQNRDEIDKLAFYGAYRGNELLGVIAARNGGSHIALFFVKEEYHRQGIGRALFQTLLENSKAAYITVNASPYAKEFYHHLGFTGAGAEQEKDRIRFIPMKYQIE